MARVQDNPSIERTSRWEDVQEINHKLFLGMEDIGHVGVESPEGFITRFNLNIILIRWCLCGHRVVSNSYVPIIPLLTLPLDKRPVCETMQASQTLSRKERDGHESS